MDAGSDGWPDSADLEAAARTKAQAWLMSHEARSLLADVEADAAARTAIEEYFHGERKPPMTLRDVTHYFLVDYLTVGLGSGQALRLDPVSAIFRCANGDTAICATDHVLLARKMQAECPRAYLYLLTLARKHAELCRDVLQSAFKSDVMHLRRGVFDVSKHYAVESWAFPGLSSNYGPIVLRAQVPLSAVLSLRPQENEIVVLRHAWESLIVTQEPAPARTTWRDRLAEQLEGIAERLRDKGKT